MRGVFQTICERGTVNELINARRLCFDRAANLELIDQPVFILQRPKNRVKDRWVKTRGSFRFGRYTRARAHGTCVYVHQVQHWTVVSWVKKRKTCNLVEYKFTYLYYCLHLSRFIIGVFFKVWLNITIFNSWNKMWFFYVIHKIFYP